MMRKVDLAELKTSVLDYVEAVVAGETVLVMDRERVVAELIPPRQADIDLRKRLSLGTREGWFTPPEAGWNRRLPDRGNPPDDDPDIPLEQLLEELAEDRENR